ncbi:hypothetical protein [Bradyrhizobium sp. STM 3843]|uniref:hypothetical protein n=1 Tax=unclassified Bradyrhizobium TaxID=2631580 RepID=UPI0002FA77B1|nr:hypothetical protein [Bradyrhizobium sp. STM 3843]
MTKNEKHERLVREREEITARVARFKATQERFAREREQYATVTWAKAGKNERAE